MSLNYLDENFNLKKKTLSRKGKQARLGGNTYKSSHKGLYLKDMNNSLQLNNKGRLGGLVS